MQEIIYYLYHIPGKKIGVTRNLNKRVTLQQGYASNEYEVLFSTKDVKLGEVHKIYFTFHFYKSFLSLYI